MAKDIKLLIGGSAARAEAAIRELQRTGKQSTSILERDFKQLGISSGLVFDNQRAAAKAAYEKITVSGLASRDELKRAHKAHAARLVEIDKDQYGQRTGMLGRFKKSHIAAYGAMAVAAAAYAAVRVGSAAIDEFKAYETALTDMGKVTDVSLAEIDQRIMAMPEELGNATDLMAGYYQTMSAGITDPIKAQEFLTGAAKAAKAGHVEQGNTIRGLTKLMAGFSGEIDNVTEASDLLFAMERYGQTTFAELVPVIGDVASISHQAAVGQYEMAAMMSRLTQTAGSTSQAATQYRAILMGLLKPQTNMKDMLKESGFESGRAAIKQLGLAGAIKEVSSKALDSGLQLGQLFESSEALTGLGPQLADEFGQYDETLLKVKDSAGGTEKAFDDWRQTFSATSDLFDSTINKVLIELGRELVPVVNELLLDFSEWVIANRPAIINFFGELGGKVEGVVGWVRQMATALGESYRWFQEFRSGNVGLFDWATTWAGDGLANLKNDPNSYSGSGIWTAGFDDLTGDTLADSKLLNPDSSSYSTADASFKDRPSFAVGTRYVPRTGYAQVHRGEEIRTRAEVSRSRQQPQQPNISFGDLTFNLPNITNQTTARQLAREVAPELISLFNNRYRGALPGA